MSKILTFLISAPDSETFTPDLYSKCRNFLNDANVVVLHEFKHFYNCIFKYATSDFTFRLLVHSGSADKGGIITSGDTICEEIRGKKEFKNVDICFITRKPDWFEKDEYFKLLNGKKYWNMKYFNRTAAINQFLSENKPIKKGDLITNAVSAKTKKKSLQVVKSKIFIGSSMSGFKYAAAVKKIIDENQNYTGVVWKDVFGDDNKTTIEKLEETIEKYKYSIFVFSPDDEIKPAKADSKQKIPRDNVIFEYGFFMGRGGRPNTFLMMPHNSSQEPLVHILTDISGLNYKSYIYSSSDGTDIKCNVRNACDDIINAINKSK